MLTVGLPVKVNDFVEHLRTPLYRDGYALIASTAITSLLGLLYWTLAANAYDTETVGLNSTAVSVMIFLSAVSQVNLQETMIRFIPQAGKYTLRLVLTAYGIVVALSVLVGLIFCLGVGLWSPALSFLVETPASILWFTGAIVVWGIFVIEDSVLTGLRQALWIPFENTVFSVLKIALLFALAALFPRDGIFISWTLSVAAIIIPINFLLFRRLIPAYSKRAELNTATAESSPISLRQLSKYVAGNYVAALLANMSSALLPVIITQLLGATANAHFYLAWIIASSLQIVTANLATSLTVEASGSRQNLDGFTRRAAISIARLVVPGAVILFFGAPLILQFVGPSYVEEGTVLMQLLAIAALPNILNMIYVSRRRVENRIAGVVGVYSANALLVLGLSFLLMPSFGITGVGVAWVISQTVIAFVLLVQRAIRRKRLF
jgi:O-antigen/teichoic acid export membrane protein